ncbi:D-alanyl-D-alanine carboxypeptidase [Micrococcoides hystricis]|uniref:D-alanyl-D-alanine carboxypeptidase n=1 Tax=Micrococcoides hystricis TaxID=1572761 RepID=A0ABV6PB74_9MICC
MGVQQRRRWLNRRFWFVFVLALAVVVALPALWFRDEVLKLPQLGPDNISGTQREPTGGADNPGAASPTPKPSNSQKPTTKPGAATLLAADGSLAEQAAQLGAKGQVNEEQKKTLQNVRQHIDGGVGMTHISVVDARTGKSLYTYQDGPVSPASLLKTMTSLYVLEALGPDHRFSTTVALSGKSSLQTLEPALTATVVGTGDANLTDEKITRLAKQTAEKIAEELSSGEVEGPVRVNVRVDDTAFTGGPLNSHWNPVLATNGNIAPLRPAALYGGRESPSTQANRSGADPTTVIGNRFHRELTKALAKTEADTSVQALPAAEQISQQTPQQAEQVAEVHSHTIAEDLKPVLQHSDNQIAETMLRGSLLEQGLKADEKTAAAELQRYTRGFATKDTAEQVELVDASGLAVHNTIPPTVLARATAATHRAAADPQNPRHDIAKPYVDALAVSGKSGTLKDRFVGSGTTGKLAGKTGSLLHAVALSGIVEGESGTYAFSITVDNALGQQPEAKAKVDRIIRALFH